MEMDKYPSELFAAALIGNQVRDENGASLGRIQELVIDARTGHVKSIVLSMGDWPAFGNAACAIPWEALRLERDGSKAHAAPVDTGEGSEGGKPDKTFSTYTYTVNRAL
jgi:sporulation protein YlmC with PRC-barrel domain